MGHFEDAGSQCLSQMVRVAPFRSLLSARFPAMRRASLDSRIGVRPSSASARPSTYIFKLEFSGDEVAPVVDTRRRVTMNAERVAKKRQKFLRTDAGTLKRPVRRLARTSERTSMRCSSRPLIVTKPNLCLPNLTFGRVVWTFQHCRNRTPQLCAYKSSTHKMPLADVVFGSPFCLCYPNHTP